MFGLLTPSFFMKLAGMCLLATGALSVAIAETVIVVGADSEVSALSADQARSIFLGKTTMLPNGVPAVPILQDEESPVQAQMREKILGKSAAQLQSYWAQRIFSGKATPPKVAGNDAEVKKYLTGTAGGIGYIDGSHMDDSVKVVFTIK